MLTTHVCTLIATDKVSTLMSNSEIQPGNAGSKPIILIVDDDVNVTRSLKRSLRTQFTVLTANSATEALDIIMREDIAVVLTDQRMPERTGVELLQQIQHIRPESVGIIISGYTDIAALIDAINLGTVRGYVPKPWDIAELRHRLKDAVNTYHASFLKHDILHSSAEAVTRMQNEMAGLYRALDSLAAGESGQIPPPDEDTPSGRLHAHIKQTLPPPTDPDRESISQRTRLSERMPTTFQQLAEQYGYFIDFALEQRVHKIDQDLSSRLRAFSQHLGHLRAGPRDVVEIYSTALKLKLRNIKVQREMAIMEEGRLILLEVMGYLIAYYRSHLLAFENTSNV